MEYVCTCSALFQLCWPNGHLCKKHSFDPLIVENLTLGKAYESLAKVDGMDICGLDGHSTSSKGHLILKN